MNVNARSSWPVLLRSSAVGFGFALWAFAACTSDDDGSNQPAGDPADCRLIANRCHPYDDGSNLAHECHEVGHDGVSPAECTRLRASCLDACPEREPDAGSGGSAGSAQGGSSGATSSGGTAGSGTAGAAGGSAGEPSGGTAGSSGTTGQGGVANGGSSTGGASNGGSSMAGMSGSGTAGGGTGGTGPDGGETACETLGRVCHGVGTGFTEECHELGHDGDEEACEEELAACLAACQDGGV
jgi:hypothetical protein